MILHAIYAVARSCHGWIICVSVCVDYWRVKAWGNRRPWYYW